MCGILSIVNFKNDMCGRNLAGAAAIIKHRGPDDEGFLTWQPDAEPVIWAGKDTAVSTRDFFGYKDLPDEQQFKAAFGHRRLSILDLSPAGHQPMLYPHASLALTFNGEIYNYLEIKAELEGMGHTFKSTSDTEVLLHAWQEWGSECMHRFNGMFAFIILDYHKKTLYAVRDRFGVKPLYYYEGESSMYFASEIKQIRTSPDYAFTLNEVMGRQFLATGATDHTDQTFDSKIKHLPAGHYMCVDLSGNDAKYEIIKWYTLKPQQWKGSYQEAVTKFRSLLTDAVALRLRSDVTVGSCLSGGLDSSSIVCIAADLLEKKGEFAGQETVTACFDNAKYDEWNFAQEVIKQTNARAHQTFPSFSQLQGEVNDMFWHQDEPVGSTSVFSQWAVFKATHEAGLKVMIDGQGADEQLAGYGGNDTALYGGLMRNMQLSSIMDEAICYKKYNGSWPIGFLLAGAQLSLGKKFARLVPKKIRFKPYHVDWITGDEPDNIYHYPAHSLKENLLRQLYIAPLPALLRYEDHNSMAWSVESRTPFMDYRLVEFTLGLPPRYVYKNGLRKTILRDAMEGIIPTAIKNRKDKMGFVTPEEIWLKEEGKQWFIDGVEATLKLVPHLFNEVKVRELYTGMIAGNIPFDFSVWRIFAFGKWYASMTANA